MLEIAKRDRKEGVGDSRIFRTTELVNKALAKTFAGTACEKFELVPAGGGARQTCSAGLEVIGFVARDRHTKEQATNGTDILTAEFAKAVVDLADSYGFEPKIGGGLLDRMDGGKTFVRLCITDEQRLMEYPIVGQYLKSAARAGSIPTD